MTRRYTVLTSILLGTPLFLSAPLFAQRQPQRPDWLLHTGWDDATAKLFWHQDQGSMLMPKTWFDKMIDPQTRQPFSAGLERFGFIPDPDNPQVPYIGLSIHTDEKNTQWIGLTCAACHTGQWKYNGKRILVDGAPAMLDFDAFFGAMVKAIDANPNAGSPPADYRALSDKLHRRLKINRTTLAAGFGRVDAFGQIFNQVSIVLTGNDAETAAEPNAPTSYPCLWDIAQHKFVQWNGSAPNLGVKGDGAKLRNIGEVIGVFGDLTPNPGYLPKFPSSINYESIEKIEDWISKLRSPQWPEKIFGEIGDLTVGERMYSRHCERCHAIVKGAPKYPLPVTMVLADDVATDPAMVDNFGRVANTRWLKGQLILTDPRQPFARFGSTAPVRQMAGHYAVGALTYLERRDLAFVFKALIDGIQAFAAGDPGVTSYKARPLDGVWATAPYLHNGSVANLWELLQDPDKRARSFCVGSQVFDPQKVGYSSNQNEAATCPPNSFLFDTSLPGNTKDGHIYGVHRMSDSEKWELIKFLKSL